MLKHEEFTNDRSCLSRAYLDEMVFVLLARDVTAPATIRFWIERRIESGKNKRDDPQIQEAEACARHMEEHGHEFRADYCPDGIRPETEAGDRDH
jgi:hypothetical protein